MGARSCRAKRRLPVVVVSVLIPLLATLSPDHPCKASPPGKIGMIFLALCLILQSATLSPDHPCKASPPGKIGMAERAGS
jgi:hypothetical protein